MRLARLPPSAHARRDYPSAMRAHSGRSITRTRSGASSEGEVLDDAGGSPAGGRAWSLRYSAPTLFGKRGRAQEPPVAVNHWSFETTRCNSSASHRVSRFAPEAHLVECRARNAEEPVRLRPGAPRPRDSGADSASVAHWYHGMEGQSARGGVERVARLAAGREVFALQGGVRLPGDSPTRCGAELCVASNLHERDECL